MARAAKYEPGQRAGISDQARFWKKVDKTREDGCWYWTGPINEAGYGMFTIGSRAYLAHRLSYMLATGIILAPGEGMVCHNCDNRPCVRPDHLYLGTAKTNADDYQKRGPGRGRGRPPTITEEKISMVITMKKRGFTVAEIVKAVGISAGSVHLIWAKRGA